MTLLYGEKKKPNKNAGARMKITARASKDSFGIISESIEHAIHKHLLVERFQEELKWGDGTELVEVGQCLSHGLEESQSHRIGHLRLEQLDEHFVWRQLMQDATHELTGDRPHFPRNVKVTSHLPRVRCASSQSIPSHPGINPLPSQNHIYLQN